MGVLWGAREEGALRRMLVPVALVGLVLIGAFGGTATFASADEARMDVTESDLHPWPFTVTSGTLRCHEGGKVTFTADRTEYAVNPSAEVEYPRIDPLRRSADSVRQVDIRDAVERGLELCR